MRRTATAILVTLLFAALATSAQADAIPPAPTDDHGLFLNVLPAGQGQNTTTADATQYELTGDPPEHDMDQYDMYSSLRLAQNLKDADLSKYYKPETFTQPTGEDAVSTENPETGLTIIRDKFNVPHIYGETREEAMFGAGWASGEDRLFEMDVLRHVGRGRLSEFLGATPANLEMDEASYQVGGYDESELQAQVDRLHQYGADGDQVIADGQAFVDGINAKIDEMTSTAPDELPAEYGALQIQPEHWSETDVVAVAMLIQAQFASGGGDELQNAIFLRDAQKKLGKTKGTKLWRDLREMEDPAAPVTADGTFPYMSRKKIDPQAVAVPAPTSVKQYAVVTDAAGQSGNAPNFHGQSPIALLHAGLTRLGLALPDSASNWLAVTAKHTKSGHPIAVMGPQTGYWSPEILMEIDIHAPGLDARGATFPGISLYVLLGRGPDFAWSATSGDSDLIDVRAEKLCNKDGSDPTVDSTGYMFDGTCTDMFTRTDSWFAKPSAGGTGPPDQVTADVKRTVHGPVFATGVVGGAPVAFAIQRSTFQAELDSAISFVYLNSDRVTDPDTFQQAMSFLTGSFNWLYVDDKHVAYYHSGLYPIRAKGVDPDLPSWGTGEWEWNGFVSAANHPQAVDPKKGWIDSWNNKPAHGWHAADGQWAWGPVHRVQMLALQLRKRVPQGGMTPADMVQIMANAATTDLRGEADLSLALRVLGQQKSLNKYLKYLRTWITHGTQRIDRDGDGQYENQAAVAFMDAWWPNLIHKMFDPSMGALYDDAPMGFHDAPGAVGSSFIDGYYGYVQKALKMALGRNVPHAYHVLRCADGTLAGCRKALVASIKATVKALGDDPTKWDVDEDADSIDYAAVGLVDVPNMPWQNRPTFQQVVQASSSA